MSRHPGLYQWAATVASHFPALSASQAFVLALWTFGMVLARSCGLSQVALALAPLLLCSDNTVRQRLREFYQEAGAKKGDQRRDLDPATCFAPLLAWVLEGWTCRRLALALDATALGDRLTVLAVSVVYRGCAIPVAWAVLPGNTPGAWLPHWEALLDRLHPALGPGWQVVVLSDRGLESAQLFAAIALRGWHPLMRVKAVGHFRPAGWAKFYPLAQFAPRVGSRWAGAGAAYKRATARLECTLLAGWQEGHEDRWLLLTDLAPAAAAPAWYAFRAWIEQGFKVIKSAGWQWQRARMTDPARAARLWVAVAVATLWLLEVGGAAEAALAAEAVPPLPGAARPRRLHRVFRQGLARILAGLVGGGPLPRGHFAPEPWPPATPVDSIMDEEAFAQQDTYP